MSRTTRWVVVLFVTASCAGPEPPGDPPSPPGSSGAEPDFLTLSEPAGRSSARDTEGAARGALTCRFSIAKTMPPTSIAAALERDRMFMSARPGFLSKLVPLGLSGDQPFSGGYYWFDSVASATRYLRWVETTFVVDGVHFFDRWYFGKPTCRVYEVVGSATNAAPSDWGLVRSESFDSGDVERSDVAALWKPLEEAARKRNLSALTLMWSAAARRVTIVYVDPLAHVRKSPERALADFARSEPLGLLIEKHFPFLEEETSFVFTVWSPFRPGDRGKAPVWPHATLPRPSCGDGVCSPSLGEEAIGCPADCGPSCGDGLCGDTESVASCPADCIEASEVLP